MNQRIGAGHHAGKFGPVGDRGKDADMRIARDALLDRLEVAALPGQHHAHRPARAGGGDGIDQHRPALFRSEAAHADQQRGLLGQLAQFEQALAQAHIAVRGREHARIDAHRVGDDTGQPALREPVRQALARADDHVELGVELAQVAPVAVERLVDHRARRDAVKPAVGIGRKRIGMHDQRARRFAGPFADKAGAAPRRGGLDHVRCLAVQRGIERGHVVEVAVVEIEREHRALEPDDACIRTAFLDAVFLARRNDHDFMAHGRTGLELAVHVGAHAATLGRVEGADIDKFHEGHLRPFERSEREQAGTVIHHNTQCG